MSAFLVGHSAHAETVDMPTGLLCELLRWPEKTTISDLTPEFAWVVPQQTVAPQTHYQVQVDLASTQFKSGHPFWDTGKIAASSSTNFEYKGPSLHPGESYCWRVRIWRAGHHPSPFTEPQFFRLAAQGTVDWVPTQLPVTEELAPATVRQLAASVALVDFGRTAFGYVEVNKGGTVDFPMRFCIAELLAPVHDEPFQWMATVARPPAFQGWLRVPIVDPPRPSEAIPLQPAFGVVAPIRYLRLEPVSTVLARSDVRLISVHYPFDDAESEFHSSDEELNKIWDLCKHTIKATSFVGMYVDGDRERIPYEADAYIAQLSHYAVDREFAMARKTIDYLIDHPTWPTEWRFHSIFSAWNDYLYTGNAEALVKWYPRLKEALMVHRIDDKTGLFRGFTSPLGAEKTKDIIDWPETERDGYAQSEYSAVVNAFFYRAMSLMKRIAAVVGANEDAQDFAFKENRIKNSFCPAFLDNDSLLFRDGIGIDHSSIHANFFPLVFKLVPERAHPDVLRFIKRRGMACSIYGAQYLLEALFEAGEDRTALALMTDRTTDRSWFHMTAAGATTTWEAWDRKYKENMDLNHVWGTAPANLLSRYVLGVRPTEPGFKCILVAPLVGSLEYVSGRVPTILGAVSVYVHQTQSRVTMRWTAPSNSTVTVRYPLKGKSVKQSWLNGKSIKCSSPDSLEINPAPSKGELLIELRVTEMR